jgi:hypothetical protein
MKVKYVSIASGILLLVAILPWASAFYDLLRLAIFASSIIVAYNFYNSKKPAWALIFGAVAFLFNPIFPIHIYVKSTWVVFDFIGACLFFAAAYSKNK